MFRQAKQSINFSVTSCHRLPSALLHVVLRSECNNAQCQISNCGLLSPFHTRCLRPRRRLQLLQLQCRLLLGAANATVHKFRPTNSICVTHAAMANANVNANTNVTECGVECGLGGILVVPRSSFLPNFSLKVIFSHAPLAYLCCSTWRQLWLLSSYEQVAHALLTQSATNLLHCSCCFCCSVHCLVDLRSLWVAGEDHQTALFAVSLFSLCLLLLPVMNCSLCSQPGLACHPWRILLCTNKYQKSKFQKYQRVSNLSLIRTQMQMHTHTYIGNCLDCKLSVWVFPLCAMAFFL